MVKSPAKQNLLTQRCKDSKMQRILSVKQFVLAPNWTILGATPSKTFAPLGLWAFALRKELIAVIKWIKV
jgi:hypothetical protein